MVVSPLSTIGHWAREFSEWTHMNVLLFQGNQANRDMIKQYEFYFPGSGTTKGEYKFDILLTTFEMLMTPDWSNLQQIKWKCIVVDEAQRLKNTESKLITNLRTFKSEHRILLTGTPIQNNTQELWSLLNFIEPGVFTSAKEFAREFGQLEDADQVAKLHGLLRPFLLRRMKEDVEKSIPPKEETLIEVELSNTQKQYYKAILEGNREFLNKGVSSKNAPNLLNVVMQLRKVCNHPFLIKGVEDRETIGKETNAEYFNALVESSGKMILLDKLLPKLKEGGHKVLIYERIEEKTNVCVCLFVFNQSSFSFF